MQKRNKNIAFISAEYLQRVYNKSVMSMHYEKFEEEFELTNADICMYLNNHTERFRAMITNRGYKISPSDGLNVKINLALMQPELSMRLTDNPEVTFYIVGDFISKLPVVQRLQHPRIQFKFLSDYAGLNPVTVSSQTIEYELAKLPTNCEVLDLSSFDFMKKFEQRKPAKEG